MTDENRYNVRISWERYQKIRHCLKYTDKVTIGYIYEVREAATPFYPINEDNSIFGWEIRLSLYHNGECLGHFPTIEEKPKSGFVQLTKCEDKPNDDSDFYCAAHHVPEWDIGNVPLRYHWDKFIEDEDTVWVRYTAVGLISFALGLFIG